MVGHSRSVDGHAKDICKVEVDQDVVVDVDAWEDLLEISNLRNGEGRASGGSDVTRTSWSQERHCQDFRVEGGTGGGDRWGRK